MENERVIMAIGRIERALSSIESAKAAKPELAADPALEQRHASLKKEMQHAIHTIDNLIARQES